MKRNQRLKLLGLLFLTSMLLGCDSGSDDLEAYVKNLRATQGPAVQKTLDNGLPTPVASKYEADAPRPPFVEPEHMKAEKKSEAINPLFGYPITMLRFVGTVTQNGSTYAYVTTPDNLLFKIGVGDRLGDQKGIVVEILADRIKVEERDQVPGKKAMSHMVTLRLRDENQ